MSRRLIFAPLLWMLLIPAQAQTIPGAVAISEGRDALEAEQPARARVLFAAALADPERDPGDTYAAAMGLGKAAVWLGDYAAAARAFGLARDHADDDAGRQAADTGLAQALNAQDYPRAAYALVAPFAQGRMRPTLEVLRALQALGWQDKSPSYVEAVESEPTESVGGIRYTQAKRDMEYALAPQIDVTSALSQDSDGLEIYTIGSAFRFAPYRAGSSVRTWGVSFDTTRIQGAAPASDVNRLGVTSRVRIDDIHRLDLDMGLGRAGSWSYLHGAASWTRQASDGFSVSVAAERAPILTDLAIHHRLIYNTYSVGTALRPAARWTILPTYYRQSFSDGNTRDGGTLRLRMAPYDIPSTSSALGAELSARVFHSSAPTRGVYFNPSRYRVAQLNLIAIHTLNPDWKLRARLGGGRQAVDGADAGVYGVGVAIEGRLPANSRLSLSLDRSSAASGTQGGGPGYWSNSALLSLSCPL